MICRRGSPNLSPRAELLLGDVADRAVVEQALLGVDGCFHLAAVASVERCNRDWIGSRTNLTGTITIFACARATMSPGGDSRGLCVLRCGVRGPVGLTAERKASATASVCIRSRQARLRATRPCRDAHTSGVRGWPALLQRLRSKAGIPDHRTRG